MSENSYYVQCISGDPSHVMEAIPDTPLEAKCKARAAQGFLDALCLNTDECPSCLCDAEERDRRFANTCADVGCAFMDDRCENGCIAIREAVGQSPYEGQLRGVALT